MTTALVTGGTGFIGGAVVDRLLDAGWDVTVLARSPQRLASRHQGHVSVLTADLRQVLPTLPAVDAIVHAAADMETHHATRLMQETTVAGTQRLLDAARKAGVGRFLHVSSQAVYGFDVDYHDADETTPMRPSPYAYCETKRLAEEAVWAAGRHGLPVTVVRPGFVYGPGDYRSLPPVVAMLRQGKIKAHIGGGDFDTCPLHVENCADGIYQALITEAAAGEAYHLGDGRVLTIRQLAADLCRKLGVPEPTGHFPFAAAMAMAKTIEGTWRLFRREGPPPMTAFTVAMLHRNSGFRIDKARRQLGYDPRRQWEESLDELVAWCLEAV
jgi:nucleoside-diphosphate-sugar epimerase